MRFLCIAIFLLFSAPRGDYQQIVWNENYRLTWDDFLGEPNYSAGFVASTNTGINFGYSFTVENRDLVKVNYSVESFFNREKSWFIPGRVSQHILNHEQAHFDISEIHARMLRKKLDSYQFTKNVKTEIENIYLQVEAQRKAMQVKFDAETDHSRNVKKEIIWENRIEKLLKQYDSWKQS